MRHELAGAHRKGGAQGSAKSRRSPTTSYGVSVQFSNPASFDILPRFLNQAAQFFGIIGQRRFPSILPGNFPKHPSG